METAIIPKSMVRTIVKKCRFTIRGLLLLTAVSAAAIGGYQYLSRHHSVKVDLASQRYYERQIERIVDRTGVPFIRVVAFDTGQPIPNVLVQMTLIGPDGGDGGCQTFVTTSDGCARQHVLLQSGRYQYELVPPPNSRFCETAWRRGDPYLTIRDGLCHPAQVQVKVR